MPALFSAIIPPAEVFDHLAGRLADHGTGPGGPAVPGVRWEPMESWHITLKYFGDDDDPVPREEWLRRRLVGLVVPRLRLAGTAVFPGALWVRVETDDAPALVRLGQAGGAEPGGFEPHLTVAKSRDPGVGWEAVAGPLNGYCGPWFQPGDVRLMRTDLGSAVPTYATVATLPLAPGRPSHPDGSWRGDTSARRLRDVDP